MCGRYTLAKGKVDELADRFEATLRDADAGGAADAADRYNVAPTQEVLAVVPVRDSDRRELRLLKWGLRPHWAKDSRSAYKMINARAETIAEKPAFKVLLRKPHRHALILARGYLEWLRPEAKDQPKQPMHFTVDGGEVFAFAGLWTEATFDDESLASCTIITTAANDLVSPIHDRMPVILGGPAQEAGWLDRGLNAEEAAELLRPLDPARMSVAPANPAINKVAGTKEGPELLEPPEGVATAPRADPPPTASPGHPTGG